MSKIAVIYWSGTGNTEAMADLVANAATAAGADVDKFTASEFNVASAGDYTGFALGCPAMGAEQLAPVQRIVDRITGIFVPVVLGIAILTFVLWVVIVYITLVLKCV